MEKVRASHIEMTVYNSMDMIILVVSFTLRLLSIIRMCLL